MDPLTPLLNGVLLIAVALVLGWMGKERFDRLDRQIERLDGRIDGLRVEMNERFEVIRQEHIALREDLTSKIEALREDLTSKIEALREDLTSKIEALWEDLTSKTEALREEGVESHGRTSDRFLRVETELAALRSDITQIALAVGARPRPSTG